MHFKTTKVIPSGSDGGHTELRTSFQDGSVIYSHSAPKKECIIDQSLDGHLFELECLISNNLPIGDKLSGSYIESSPESVMNQVGLATQVLNSLPNEEGTSSEVN